MRPNAFSCRAICPARLSREDWGTEGGVCAAGWAPGSGAEPEAADLVVLDFDSRRLDTLEADLRRRLLGDRASLYTKYFSSFTEHIINTSEQRKVLERVRFCLYQRKIHP